MKLLRLAGIFALMGLGRAKADIDLNRTIRVIETMEGGTWGHTMGGAGYMLRSTWGQYTKQPYENSRARIYALPVYVKHLRWLERELVKGKQPVTAGRLYLAWRWGLTGSQVNLPSRDLETRANNLYDDPTF